MLRWRAPIESYISACIAGEAFFLRLGVLFNFRVVSAKFFVYVVESRGVGLTDKRRETESERTKRNLAIC